MRCTARTATVMVLAGLSASATMLALAPILMPSGYSWLSMTTSESAAQGIAGAWLARLGFVVFGLSVVLLTMLRHRLWGPATVLHGAFGLFLLGAAAFATRSWVPGMAYDRVEDVLHSVAATAMGFAFAVGVGATALRARSRGCRRFWLWDAAAVVASGAIPLAMSTLPDLDGALQRVMFVVAYAWYAAEAVRAGFPVATGSARRFEHALPVAGHVER